MTILTSEVSQAAVLKQAVLNTSQSIELLREAVSNSIDADARDIDVKLVGLGGDEWDVIIQDNGNGMEERHMRAFFNAGQTVKDFPQNEAIGEKGLGSKTTFVAGDITVESRRYIDAKRLLVGKMHEPMKALMSQDLPTYSIEYDPLDHESELNAHGTRITLSRVHLSTFNGKRTSDPAEIALRIMHYLRSMCATGTVKNRHAAKDHVAASVMNVGVVPRVTVEVINASGSENLGPEPGVYKVPQENLSPDSGPATDGVVQKSKNFCAVLDFTGSKTFSLGGETVTVHYDGTAVVAGDNVRAEMLKNELRQGWTQKSQMGVHLCKDFIPLRTDSSISRDLLDPEYYYEYKVFLNSQSFQLNADRNVVTNLDSDEVAWIMGDFRQRVWPQLQAKAAPYQDMVRTEKAALESVRKTAAAERLKATYSQLAEMPPAKNGAALRFIKAPRKEADVSHLLAMLVQSGEWNEELRPIASFGQYIDDSTDIIAEDHDGLPMLLEVETELPNLFKHRHPMSSYEIVVVWNLGGMTNGTTKQAPWGTNGAEVSVTLLEAHDGSWSLKWGTHSKKVVVLSRLFD